MDSGLDKNEAELGVFVLSIALKMLSYGNSLQEVRRLFRRERRTSPYLLDQHVKILWNLWCEAYHESLRQSKDQTEAMLMSMLLLAIAV
jgi:hypothetical protein